ncbi:MAG: AAA family ATPase [Oscillospiraceae bacterium]|nr:AAA family ATPase [Oscillospiraceae bacterium]
MKGSISASEVHRQYSDGISAFRGQIADGTLRAQLKQEVDPFMRTCALGLWAQDGQAITPRHVEYYNAIYTKGGAVPSVLYWELSTAVTDYPGFQPPAFFRRMRQNDRETGGSLSRDFIDLMVLMLLLFAAVDDVVSEQEAGFVNACADALGALCGADGIVPDKMPLKAEEFVSKPMPQTEQEAVTPEPEQSVEELLAELDDLCGLEKVKADVKSLINLVRVRKLRQEHALPVPPMSLHLVFMGNPGTGKTTVARLLAKIYHAIGVLSKGQLVEVDRSGLVAGFVGQTAIKTSEAVGKALGGVLFIDEAYALTNVDSPNDFGREAIEVLLKAMEDHRDDFIVIVAGYTALMDDFVHSNPGLESRFNKYFYFDDYTAEQMYEIFCSMCDKNGYILAPEAEDCVKEQLKTRYDHRDENFGNAREVRNLFEHAVARQADRIAGLETPDKETLMTFVSTDMREETQESAAPAGISGLSGA